MSRPAVFFLLIIAPLFAILLALLGLETRSTTPLGWFLFLLGVTYTAGVVISYTFGRKRYWSIPPAGEDSVEEKGDRSFWGITAAMAAVFLLAPLDLVFLRPLERVPPGYQAAGVVLLLMGLFLFTWARRAFRMQYSGHLAVKEGQPLVQTGPYRIIRHPAYTAYLLLSAAAACGYASLPAAAAFVLLLLPAVLYRIRVEERLLGEHYGERFRGYQARTKRLLPWIF